MKSMTGYAARDAEGRRWEMRSVNARGLDLRLRLPDMPAGLEPAVRASVTGTAARGNVSVSLRLTATGPSGPVLNAEALARAVDAMAQAEAVAQARGLPLAPSTAAGVLSVRGVWEAGEAEAPPPLETLRADLADLVAAWDADRAREGAALREVLSAQIDEIARLRQAAIDLAPARADHIAETFRAAAARLEAAQIADDRVRQEIAALAVKADIAEELDRLAVHIDAARALLDADGPVGRRLDFLTQEFVRETNTICSKSGLSELTAIGLELKTVIDRLREQVQNVE
ncbi:YicC family protein [Jannaschia seohaensis]|uniref:TIGR00255 family protein n=1 Tax=Jannaschia seohaensis TaxID=475081 RepID=A0A2Y9BXQ8_9RHOB|nr:DUF1732 domain-containing protein [Jannaschia seohaensis]PWJ20842.1 uncharacterized protein (TIGR00255 family) [Jannaschia seohaensis]SSA41252.1 TIGR00255 family protein [Jannaschia seohaensis]